MPLWYQTLLSFLCLVAPLLPRCATVHSGDDLDRLRIKEVTGCDGQEVFVRCPENTVIDVTSAMYGRGLPSSMICPYLHTLGYLPPDFNENLHCVARNSFTVIQQSCQERRHCHIMINYKMFGGDPCPRTGKYLTVGYRCMPVRFVQKLTCEGSRVSLQCERGKRLHLSEVYYKWDVHIPAECLPRSEITGGQSTVDTPHNSTDCFSTKAQVEVQKRCSQRRTCLIEVSDTVLGRACAQKIKYLDIRYTCVSKNILYEQSAAERTEGVGTPATAANSRHVSLNDRPDFSTKFDVPDPGASHTKMADAIVETVQKLAPLPVLSHHRTVFNLTEAEQMATLIIQTCNDTSHATHQHTAIAGDDLLMGWVHSVKYMQDNQEKMVLYGALCGCLALLLALSFAIGRLLHTRRASRHRRRHGSRRHESNSERHKLNVSDDPQPPSSSADQSNEENTYVPAIDPSSDVVGLTSYGLGLTDGGGGSSRSDDVFHHPDQRHTYYENDDGEGTRTNSFYDRHS